MYTHMLVGGTGDWMVSFDKQVICYLLLLTCSSSGLLRGLGMWWYLWSMSWTFWSILLPFCNLSKVLDYKLKILRWLCFYVL